MRQNQILITDTDLRRLQDEIQAARSSWQTYTPLVEILDARLRRARVIAPQDIPRSTVTMNSRFWLRNPHDESAAMHTLVYPLEADIEEGNVSVLSPLGLAVLGAQVGEFVWWAEDGESHSGRIDDLVFQPEAVGACHV